MRLRLTVLRATHFFGKSDVDESKSVCWDFLGGIILLRSPMRAQRACGAPPARLLRPIKEQRPGRIHCAYERTAGRVSGSNCEGLSETLAMRAGLGTRSSYGGKSETHTQAASARAWRYAPLRPYGAFATLRSRCAGERRDGAHPDLARTRADGKTRTAKSPGGEPGPICIPLEACGPRRGSELVVQSDLDEVDR
jgi:hypothetical protein